MSDRRALLAARTARRAQSTTGSTVEARREAHRQLRMRRGREAATLVKQAASAVIDPHAEFRSRQEWRAWLDTLYPAWAAEIGERLWADRHCLVVIAPDEPPRKRASLVDAPRLNLSHYGDKLDADGLWRIPVGEPLPDDQAGYVEPHRHSSRCEHSTARRLGFRRPQAVRAALGDRGKLGL